MYFEAPAKNFVFATNAALIACLELIGRDYMSNTFRFGLMPYTS
jgi:hypothetical protein